MIRHIAHADAVPGHVTCWRAGVVTGWRRVCVRVYQQGHKMLKVSCTVLFWSTITDVIAHATMGKNILNAKL